MTEQKTSEQEQLTVPQELQTQVQEYMIRKNSFDIATRDFNVESSKLITSLLKQVDKLTKELTKTKLHIKYDSKSKDKIICTCGKSVYEPCPEHRQEWNDLYTIDLNRTVQASGYMILEHAVKIEKLNFDIKSLQEENIELKIKLAKMDDLEKRILALENSKIAG